MPRRLLATITTFALLWVSAAQAQTNTENPTAAPNGDDPDVTTERYRDWALSCRTDDGVRRCSMFQRLVVQDSNQVALNIAIGFLENDEGNRVPVAILTFPLGIYLPGGAVLQVDETEPAQLQIERCFRRGCQSGLALDDKRIAQFRAGSTANVRIMQSREQAINLNVSLSGFSAAFNALQASTTAN